MSEDVARTLRDAAERVDALQRPGGGVYRDASGVLRDATGKPFEQQRGGQAPAVVRAGSLGDRPYSIVRLTKGIFERRAREMAPLEFDVSERLRALGYECAPGSVLIPLGASDHTLADVPGREADCAVLRRELKAVIAPPHIADPEELAAVRASRAKAMTPDDDLLGGSLIPLPARGPHIELLRAEPVVQRAGALVVPIPPGHGLNFPKTTSGATFDYYAANDTIDDSQISTGSMQLTPKRLAGLIYIANDLVRYSAGVAESIIRADMAAGIQVTEDRNFLDGPGGGTKPLGILRYGRSADDVPEADKVTLHLAGTVAANGDTFAPEDPETMVALIEEADDRGSATAWIMRPLMFAAIANRRVDQGAGAGTGQFIFMTSRGAIDAATPRQLNGVPVFATTQTPKTMRKGNATTLTSILTGNFRQVVIGRVGVVEIAVSEDARLAQDQLAIRIQVRSDMGLRHAQSLVVCPTLLIA